MDPDTPNRKHGHTVRKLKKCNSKPGDTHLNMKVKQLKNLAFFLGLCHCPVFLIAYKVCKNRGGKPGISCLVPWCGVGRQTWWEECLTKASSPFLPRNILSKDWRPEHLKGSVNIVCYSIHLRLVNAKFVNYNDTHVCLFPVYLAPVHVDLPGFPLCLGIL